MVNTQVPSEVGENQLNLVDAETNLSGAIEQQTDEWVFNYLRTRFINILTNPMDVENDSRAFSTVLYMIQFIKEKAIREAVNNAFLDACRTEGGSLKTTYKDCYEICILTAGVVYDMVHAHQLSCNLLGYVSARDAKFMGLTDEEYDDGFEELERELEAEMTNPQMMPEYSSTYDGDEWVYNYLRSRYINIISSNMDTENDSRAFATVLYMIQFVKDRPTREIMTKTFLDACKIKTYKACSQICTLTAGLIYDVLDVRKMGSLPELLEEIGEVSPEVMNDKSLYLKKLYDLTPLPNLCPELKPLATYLAERVCGIDTQDCLIILSGQRGSGKSISALKIAQEVAKEISRLKYGDFSKASEIFNISHLASIDEESLLDIISKVQIENSVIILDDGSIALNARNAMSAINKAVVDLITISRHKRNVVIITTPARGQIDINIRKMCSHWAHVVMSHHEEGYNEITFRAVAFDQEKDLMRQKNITAHMLGYEGKNSRKIKIQRWIVPKPDDEQLVRDYEEMRSSQGDDLIAKTNERLKIAIRQKQEKMGLAPLGDSEPISERDVQKEIKKQVKQKVKSEQKLRKIEEFEELRMKGATVREAAKATKLSTREYYAYKNAKEQNNG